MRIKPQVDGTMTAADQQALTQLLAKAGYTVHATKESRKSAAGSSLSKINAVDFWGDGERVE